MLLLLIIIMAAPGTRGTSPQAGLSLTVNTDAVTASINIRMFQNLTLFQKTFTLPTFHGLLDGGNASSAASVLQNAIRLKSPPAKVEGLRLEASSTAWSDATGTQWFNVSMSFNVRGVSTATTGVAQVDLSWKSFAITSNVTIAGFEVNSIGASYLLGVAGALAKVAATPSPFVELILRVNGIGTSPDQFASEAQRILTLNFSRLSVPASQWKYSYVPLASTESWSFTGGRFLGISTTVLATAEAHPTPVLFGIFYDVEGQITAPRSSYLQGDTVKINSGLPEAVMGATILSTTILAFGTIFYERRLSNRTFKKKSGR